MSDKADSECIVACVTDAVNTACRENNVPEINYPWRTETKLRDKVHELVAAMTVRRISLQAENQQLKETNGQLVAAMKNGRKSSP